MIMSIRHGLRLRKREEDVRSGADEPLLDEHRDRRRYLSFSSPSFVAVVVVLALIMLGAISKQGINHDPALKGAKELSMVPPVPQQRPDTISLPGGLALHIPGRDRKENLQLPWTLYACATRHGTSCPDSLEFPLHVQLRRRVDGTGGSFGNVVVQAPTWKHVDAQAVCPKGGGKAWQINLPPTTGTIGIRQIELRWFRHACLHGYPVAPWEQVIDLPEQPEDRAISTGTAAVPSIHHKDLFVSDAMWRQTLDKSKAVNVPPYIWSTPEGNMSERLTTEAGAFVLPDAIVKMPQPGYGRFTDLSNYELLCFLGNRTMADIRGSFLQIRPQIFKNQRPFKFHFYDLADLQQPDRYWTESNKERLRKCKHLLVDMEEFDPPLSQRDYEDQVKNFVGHLLRVMDDETFPIRLFTWSHSPIDSRHCHSPYLPWTNNHPCNDVLFKLFDPQEPSVFPSRVKLLDNTDLTTPYLENKDIMTILRPYVLAAIALRIYVLVGEQVAIWRAAKQIGKVDGLHRNGKIEPNFQLVPYQKWGEPL